MPRCECCGNDYDKAFVVTMGGVPHTFDSFECAIYTLAPACEHCGCRIIGHGMEVSGRFFCCAHCAHSAGAMASPLRRRLGRNCRPCTNGVAQFARPCRREPVTAQAPEH